MAVTAYNGNFSFRQNELATKGIAHGGQKMSSEQAKKLQDSPFMLKAKRQEDYTTTLSSERDKKRRQRDKDFDPQDGDYSDAKAFDYDKAVNYYVVLGLDEFSSLEEVKKAYKKLSLLYHPDKTAGLPKEDQEERAAIFIEMKNAYLTLADQATRRQYDRDRDFADAGCEVNGFVKRKDKVPFDATEVWKKIQELYKPPGKEIETEVLCKLEKFVYGGAKHLKLNRRVIRDFQESYEDKHFRIDVPKGTEEPWECKMKGGDMNMETQADTLRFVVKSKPHKVLERDGQDLRLTKPVLLRPDAHLQPFLCTEVSTVEGRSILLWGQNPLYLQAASSNTVLKVAIRGEAIGASGRLRFDARAARAQGEQGEVSDDLVVISVRTTYTKIDFSVYVCTSGTIQDLKTAICAVLEWPEDEPMQLRQRAREDDKLGIPFHGDHNNSNNNNSSNNNNTSNTSNNNNSNSNNNNNQALLNGVRSVILDSKRRALEVPMSLRRAREVLSAVTAFASTERFLEDLGRCERCAGSSEHERLLRELWATACHSAPLYGYEACLEGLRAATQRALWVLSQEPDAAVLHRRFAELGFCPMESAKARPPRRRKLPRPDVEGFLARNCLGPLKWLESEANLPDPGSETEPEEEAHMDEEKKVEQRRSDEDRRKLEAFLLHGAGAGGSRPSAERRWGRRPGGASGAAAHPLMLHRVERRKQLLSTCELELTPMFGGQSLQLFTQPTCFLHFYSNGGQCKTVKPGQVEPTPLFAVAICCPTGAKKIGRDDWSRLRHGLMPVLKQVAFLMVAEARALLPRPLMAEPVFKGAYRVADGVTVTRLGEASEEVPAAEEVQEEEALSSSDGEDDSVDIIRLAKQRLAETREREGQGGGMFDFDDLEDLDEIEAAADAIRRERREQRLRRRAAREVLRRESKFRSANEATSRRSVAEEALSPVVDVEEDAALWKALAAAAFARGDYFLAQLYYSREVGCLEGLSGESEAEQHSLAIAFSNRSACLARVHHWEAAAEDGRRAAALRPDWGRAWARVGIAAAGLGGSWLSECRTAWFRAVELDSRAEHVRGLGEACRRLAEASASSREATARTHKELGNEALRVQEFGKAVAHYTEGLASASGSQGPPSHQAKEGDSSGGKDQTALLRCVILSNRAAAFTRAKLFEAAVADAELAVSEGQDYAKAYCRLGVALLGCREQERAYSAFAAACRLDQKNQTVRKGLQGCLALIPSWASLPSLRRRAAFHRDSHRPLGTTKVFIIPELHFDKGGNEAWAHGIHATKFLDDVVIVNGNLADSFRALERALITLRAKFRRVFYMPGNHEMWITNTETQKYPDSLCKLWAILELCDELGVDVAPAAVARGVYVVPLFSWYNAEFDTKDPYPDPQYQHDKYAKWPMDPQHQVWRYMLALNRAHLDKPYHGTVITFSHFVPRTTLPVWKDHGGLKAAGCAELDEQIREARSTCHVYGHTHMKYSQVVDDVAYINRPHESGGMEEPITCVFNGKSLCCDMVGVH